MLCMDHNLDTGSEKQEDYSFMLHGLCEQGNPEMNLQL